MLEKQILKNIIFKMLLGVIRIIVPIILIPYVYKIFTPEEIGLLEFSQSITGSFIIFCGFGVYNYGIREISRVKDKIYKKEELINELVILSIGSGFLVFIIYLLFIFLFTDNEILRKMLLINSLGIIAYIFYFDWINEVYEKYKFISLKSILIKLINMIVIILLIKTEKEIYKYLFLLYFFVFIDNFIGFLSIRKEIKFQKINIVKLKKYFIPLCITIIVYENIFFLSQYDKIILGIYSKNIEEVAYYSLGQKIFSILLILINSILIVNNSRLSYYLGKNEINKYIKLLEELFQLIYKVSIPLVCLMIVLSEEIICFFGGIQYLRSINIFILWMLNIFPTIVLNIFSNQILFINKKEKVLFKLLLCGWIVNFVLKGILIFLDDIDVNNVLLGTIFIEILLIGIGYIYTNKYMVIKLSIFKIEYIKYIVVILPFFLISLIIKTFKIAAIFKILLVSIFCLIFYLIFLVIVKDKDMLKFLKIIIKK